MINPKNWQKTKQFLDDIKGWEIEHNLSYRKNLNVKKIKEEIAEYEYSNKDRALCNLCNNYISLDRLELDHKIPICLGGGDDEDNFQLLCNKCHIKKTINDKKLFRHFIKFGWIESYGMGFTIYRRNILDKWV